jgi:EAL domain-containing protein (putative c-di-GMP-specific phosphodiesterase class I)
VTAARADATALRAVGVDFGQGWYYGRPGPPEQLDVMLGSVTAGEAMAA